jgi:hypothetical protein
MITINMQTHSARAQLYGGKIHIFSDMVVDRLGRTPLALIAEFEAYDVVETPEKLGNAIRIALDQSLSWIEWKEFETKYAAVQDPVSRVLGISSEQLPKIQRSSGRVGVVDWQNKEDFLFAAWVMKGNSGTASNKGGSPISKSCSSKQLGEHVLKQLHDSLEATLKANNRKSSSSERSQ